MLSLIELGAGVGLAGLIASKLKGVERVVLTDYDHGSLQLLKDNIELNKCDEYNQNKDINSNHNDNNSDGSINCTNSINSINDKCKVSVEFLQWGKTLSSLQPDVSKSNTDNNNSNNNNVIHDDGMNNSSSSNSRISSSSSSITHEISTNNNLNNSYNDNKITGNKSDELFHLVIGTDLLYCTEIVYPLLSSAKLLMKNTPTSCFILVSSFSCGSDIEECIRSSCISIGLVRENIIELDEVTKICRVDYFRHTLRL